MRTAHDIPPPDKRAFSLVELAIVLVILGLLVGGVLSGKSLIHAAELRASIEQIKQYQVAARTFKEKYFYLPGDLPDPFRTQLNLQAPTGYADSTNGDGLISPHGFDWNVAGGNQVVGDTNFFWTDLADTKLINGTFLRGDPNLNVTGDTISSYLPASKLGGDQHIYIWNGGMGNGSSPTTRFANDGINYITIAGITNLTGANVGGDFRSNPTMPVMDAYAIDSKLDDGKPQTGFVKAIYVGNWGSGAALWASIAGPPTGPNPTTTATAASATTCMDNGGVVGPMNYSVSGNNKTCALTFRLY